MATERTVLETVESVGDFVRGFLGLIIAIAVAILVALLTHRIR